MSATISDTTVRHNSVAKDNFIHHFGQLPIKIEHVSVGQISSEQVGISKPLGTSQIDNLQKLETRTRLFQKFYLF
jgi:hypothetical protein